ncbi:DUF2971 domain-containing protein [Vibrio splendidus]
MTQKHLSHYCSPLVFKSIIENKEIWATDLRSTNDPSEVIEGNKIISKLWNEMTEDKDIQFQDNINSNDIHLSTSFSKTPDSLSQWRAYGDDGKGFSLGFCENTLFFVNSEIEWRTYDNEFVNNICTYDIDEICREDFIWDKQNPILIKNSNDNSSSQEILGNLNDPFFRVIDVEYSRESFENLIIKEIEDFNEMYSKNNNNGNLNLLMKPIEIRNFASQYKSDFYKDESEVRLHCTYPHFSEKEIRDELKPKDEHQKSQIRMLDKQNTKTLELKYRAIPTGISPYKPIKIMNYNKNALSEVVIGPKSSTSIENVKTFLNINGFHGVKVHRSKGDYR